jgi:uncharacterized membrane protein
MKNFKSIGVLLVLIHGVQVANAPQRKIKTITMADGDKKIPISIDVTNAKTTIITHNGKPFEITDLDPDPSVTKKYTIINGVLHIETKINVNYWSKIGADIGKLGLTIHTAFNIFKKL